MTHVIRILISLGVALTGLGVLGAVPAHAEDRRPCVSRVEFRTTPGLMYMSGKRNPGRKLTRRQLERFWDVRGLGVVDREFSDRRTTMWMYPVCAYSFDEAQVWVMTSRRNGPVGVAMRWYEPGATYHGHERR